MFRSGGYVVFPVFLCLELSIHHFGGMLCVFVQPS